MSGKIKNLGVMVDCSRDACYKIEAFEKFIDILAKLGYNLLMLYTEDTYELDGEPYFGYMRGRYTKEEFKRLDRYAASRGVELVPCIQTLAHLGGITRWQAYNEEIVDGNDILLIDEEKTYALIEKMFAWAAECFTTRRIHIGMDEAYAVGLGRYLDIHGHRPRFAILQSHLEKISKIADKYGFSCMLWSDMFVKTANGGEYYPKNFQMTAEIIGAVPPEMQLVYWDYNHLEQSFYESMIDGHRRFRNPIWFSGVTWSNLGFTPHNRYSMKVANASIAACLKKGVENVLITSWKDDGAEGSLFAILPALAYIASAAQGEFSEERAAARFAEATGKDFCQFLKADLPDWVNGDPDINNPVKYAMYNDPFLGLLDYHLPEGRGEYFTQIKEELKPLAKDEEYGYLFDTLVKTCEVMELKYDLGARTRKAYRAGDRAALKHLGSEIYPETAKRVEALHEAFRFQWEKECKMNGFEVHDMRLGGLILRLKHCGKSLVDYAEGKIERIHPLEEEVLPFDIHKGKGEGMIYSQYFYNAFTKPMN